MAHGRYEDTVTVGVSGSAIVTASGLSNERLSKLAKDFKRLSKKHNIRFAFVLSGSSPSGRNRRHLDDLLSKTPVKKLADEDVARIDSAVANLNAEFLRPRIGTEVCQQIARDRQGLKGMASTDRFIIAAGWKPPKWNFHRCMVQTALTLDSKRMILLTGDDFIYEPDPEEDSEPDPIPRMSWDELMNHPEVTAGGDDSLFDPHAASRARKCQLEMAAINATDPKPLITYLESKPLKTGTLVRQ